MEKDEFVVMHRLMRTVVTQSHLGDEVREAANILRMKFEAQAIGAQGQKQRLDAHHQAREMSHFVRHYDLHRHVDTTKGPTPETKSKLKADSLGILHKNGTISSEQISAAERIEWAVRLVTSGLGHKGANYESSTGGSRPARKDLTGLTDHQIDLIGVYYDWHEAMEDRRLEFCKSPKSETSLQNKYLWLADIVMDIVVHGKNLGEVEAERRVRHGGLKDVLTTGLQMFAELDGIDDPTPWVQSWHRRDRQQETG